MAIVTEQIVAFFTNAGVPVTGLSPIIRIRELDGDTLVVTDEAMTEVGDGIYRYNFTAYDTDVNYAIRCDGTSVLPSAERYAWAGNEDYGGDMASLLGPIETQVQADARQTLLVAEHDATQALVAALENPSLSAIEDAVWDELLEDTTTARDMMRFILAVLMGTSVVEENTPAPGLTRVTYRSLDGLTDRAIVTHDRTGVRSISILDGT